MPRKPARYPASKPIASNSINSKLIIPPLADTGSFSYSVEVNFFSRQLARKPFCPRVDWGECTFLNRFPTVLLAVYCLLTGSAQAENDPLALQRANFVAAWESARQGDRDTFEKSLPGLQDYLLYPYLQYEDLRHRRRDVSDAGMAAFLDEHRQWAFFRGLETAWLRTLGDHKRWDSVLNYGGDSNDTEVRCHFAHARIQRGQIDGQVPVAQKLWASGKSQPDACDPVFAWLRKQGGISSGLAWERIRLAMEARERNLARYAARFLDKDEQVWGDRWYRQDRGAYRQLKKAGQWPDTDKARDITSYGLRRLARNEPDLAWNIFTSLDGHISWPADIRGGILADLALWSAVNRSSATAERMNAVPTAYRDDRLIEWYVRYLLTEADWEAVVDIIDLMSPQLKDDSRWLYWVARARLESGKAEAGRSQMEELAQRANFYGFLAADRLDLPYTICPQEPQVGEDAIAALSRSDGIDRALELRRAGLANWARSEWKLAVSGFDKAELQVAAAVATREEWPDMAIAALGNSGDLRWYEWRFPIVYEELIRSRSEGRQLDPSWVMGLMRSESALAEDAVSHAGARGLMQITPQTAKQLAKRHSIGYRGRAQLLEAETNVEMGTAYLADLMDRFGGNPVLATGAYNAGPRVVDRWIGAGYTGDPVVWIDTLPYFETRDYIPRVLAFSTIYEWRFQRPVKRVTARMPQIESKGGLPSDTQPVTVEVVCKAAP